MDTGQNDDLQNAINGIVNQGAGAPAEVDTPDLGVPPAPAVPGVTDTPDVATTLTNAPVEPIVPAAPVEPAATPVLDEPAIAAPAEPAAPALSEPTIGAPTESVADSVMNMPETAASSELSEIKKNMIQDLIPLMDHVSIDADRKFGFYKEAITSTHDKTMVPAAYEAVKGIEDDTKKAEALLYLIDESE